MDAEHVQHDDSGHCSRAGLFCISNDVGIAHRWIAAAKAVPGPVKIVVLALALGVPFSFYDQLAIGDEWTNPDMIALTSRFDWTIGLGRSLGAMLLAVLLLRSRNPASLFVTIAAVWLAGPPLTFLLHGIFILAVSVGQTSWAGSSFEWLFRASLFPAFISIALLAPRDVRRAYGLTKSRSE